MIRELCLGGLLVVPLACGSSSTGSNQDGGSGAGAGSGGASASNGGSGASSGGSGASTSSGGSGASMSGGGGKANGGSGASTAAGGKTSSGGSTASGGASGNAGRAGGAGRGGTGSGGTAGSAGSGAAGGGQAGSTSVSATGQWVLGYHVGYQVNDLPVANIDWSALTHIAFAPLLVKADRTLDFGFSDSNGTGMQDAKAVATAAHAHGVKALLMLGGAGGGPTIAAAATSAHRAELVTALVSALGTLGYDGIDLDWEDSVNLDDLVALAAGLRAAKPDIILSYPGGPVNGNYQTVDPRYAQLAKSLDRFNVQTYYPATIAVGQGWSSWFTSPLSGVTGSTPIAIDDTFQRYVAVGVPKAKLGMGIAFYAICYTGGITGPRQPTSGSNSIVGGDNDYPLSAFFAKGSTFDMSAAGERKRDTVAAEPFLSLATAVKDSHCGGASTQYISYEDETSIAAKGAYSKANGYGGIIIWTIAQGMLPASASGGRSRTALFDALKSGFL